MRLSEYVASQAKAGVRGVLAKICRATQLSYTTIFKIYRGKHGAKLETARLIAIETCGETSHLELCLTPDQLVQIESWERQEWRGFALRLEKLRAKRAGKRAPKRAAA